MSFYFMGLGIWYYLPCKLRPLRIIKLPYINPDYLSIGDNAACIVLPEKYRNCTAIRFIIGLTVSHIGMVWCKRNCTFVTTC